MNNKITGEIVTNQYLHENTNDAAIVVESALIQKSESYIGDYDINKMEVMYHFENLTAQQIISYPDCYVNGKCLIYEVNVIAKNNANPEKQSFNKKTWKIKKDTTNGITWSGPYDELLIKDSSMGDTSSDLVLDGTNHINFVFNPISGVATDVFCHIKQYAY